MESATDELLGNEVESQAMLAEETEEEVRIAPSFAEPSFEDVDDPERRKLLERGLSLAARALQPMLQRGGTDAQVAHEALDLIVEHLRTAYRDIEDFDGALHHKGHAELQMFRFAFELAIEEFVTLLCDGKMQIGDADQAFYRLHRRLLDSHQVPNRYDDDGHLLTGGTRTKKQSLQETVRECFETEQEALYWIDCARMDVDNVLKDQNVGEKHITPQRAQAVLHNVEKNLSKADRGIVDRSNGHIAMAIEHVRHYADKMLRPLIVG